MLLAERRKWLKDELDILRREFRHLGRPPNYKEARRVQKLCPSLQLRSLPQIKTRAWILLKKWTLRWRQQGVVSVFKIVAFHFNDNIGIFIPSVVLKFYF